MVTYFDTRRIALAALLAVASAWPAMADFRAGVGAYDRGDYMAAYEEWLPLAGQGDARAQTNLGHLYRMGRGVAQNYTTALEWYRKAANQNNARAQANLANMYLKGLGITADPAAGIALFRLAAEQDFAVAQLHLGHIYRLGVNGGAKRDHLGGVRRDRLAAAGLSP